MFIAVDLPEPLGPMTATNAPRSIGEIHALQRRNRGVAAAVDLGDAGERISGAAMSLRAPRTDDRPCRRP